MLTINAEDVKRRLQRDNPWWTSPESSLPETNLPRRVYFRPFAALAMQFTVRRATVLLGPRRVGKTVMIKQLIGEAISAGFDPQSILFASIDTPIYSSLSLEKFLELMPITADQTRKIVIFDEIQYLRDWERHLKDLVDQYPNIKFIATGSAAAALRLKSKESGAGRFTEFMLPPLTFYEFLLFRGLDESLIKSSDDLGTFSTNNIEGLNDAFIEYLNYGGYPEAVFNEQVRNNPDQFIRNDIIDKVLLKDLPSLYGINDIPQLNRLFSFLAYNAGQEASFERISQESGITKPTIKKYIEYLESAFLIIKLTTVDENCRSVQRERNFKVFLNNPSMRAALFAPVGKEETEKIGHLAESAIFSQWQHSPGFRQLRYARWRNEGEVDIVFLEGAHERPLWVGEIKWSDRIRRDEFGETKTLRYLISKHKSVQSAFITTKTFEGVLASEAYRIPVTALPSALHCYRVGRNITTTLDVRTAVGQPSSNEDQFQLFTSDSDLLDQDQESSVLG